MARLPEGTLMDRAAAGLATACARELERAAGGVYGSRVVVLAGSGDNGGDALFAGARLAGRGARVTAVPAGTRVHEGGLAALRAAGGRVAGGPVAGAVSGPVVGAVVGAVAGPWGGEVAALIAGADLVLDGLVGIGGSGALREPYAGLAAVVNEADGLVVAVDVPSGVDAGTGEVAGAAVRAGLTVTFGARKTGVLVDPGAEYAGRVELVDIGLGPYLDDPDVAMLTGWDVAAMLPRPSRESDKYRRGVVGVAAGSHQYTGAAVLAVGGALRAGAGLVRYVGFAEPLAQVRTHWPEAVTGELREHGLGVAEVGRVQSWVVGPGVGTGTESLTVVRDVLASDVPVLVDADALTLVAREPSLLRRTAPTLLTPHAGELSRLLGVPRERIEAARLEHVRLAAERLGVTVLLKGSTTVVAEEGRPVRVNPTGTPWLAAGGTGDVLSGIGGALLAGGLSCYDAAACAAYIHGVAGRVAAEGAPLVAGDLLTVLPETLSGILGGRGRAGHRR
ncbi:yjeF C-terminal region, hydroxyethylthiazole kinase-related/yjeF N-terminal region [Sinosporangium album]|uniref:Bifunctional NAD(P)H-hydrate repair enzyme n=2 Tax=Sinosporangium album TaxID=504805 RepID=A0A1G8D2N9_9ACTN|nr:yjeF C-terminal region, hydroxyethylthiazole kinase-related/yjeF N-terminal region [Sinosporangium album]